MIVFSDEVIAKEVEAFTKAVTIMDDYATPLSMKLYDHFCEEMKRAVERGGICTPERMALLYPIFREINNETNETELHWKHHEAAVKKRKETRKPKQLTEAKEVVQ